MNNIIIGGSAITMTSLELADLVNDARQEFGEPEVRRNDFVARCKDELEGEYYETFVVSNPNGTESDALRMTRDQCMYVLMRESKAVRRAVAQRLKADPVPRTHAEMLLASAQALVEMERKHLEQAQAVARVEQRVDDLIEYQIMSKRPSNAEAITHIRRRMFAKYGIPAHVCDLVMRQLPYSPKPAGMVKNTREEAEGSSYAVYWVKDVNTVFKLFVAGCAQATPAFVTHPFIEGRFRLTPGAAGIEGGAA